MFKAKVVLDSVNTIGNRITTVELTYPRFIHAEIMTHRDRARNSASSRAIPWEKVTTKKNPNPDGFFQEIPLLHPKCMKGMILTEPVVPLYWGKEQKGMQSGDELVGDEKDRAIKIWLEARDNAVEAADQLSKLGVHKSLCNRLTEPFMWITVVMTATRWNNFFRLRDHPDAEKHFQLIAKMTKQALLKSKPKFLDVGMWHCPYVYEEDWYGISEYIYNYGEPDIRYLYSPLNRLESDYIDKPDFTNVMKRISAARCARVSYLTHDGKRDIQADLDLFSKLIERNDDVIHASPLEHVAMSMDTPTGSGPYIGWKQFRKEFELEDMKG